MDFPTLGIKIDLPEVLLFKGQGVLSAMGYILSIVMGIMFVIWVVYSIYAAYKIITSNMAKGLEEGMNIIKNVWVGISMGLAFFAVISLIGGALGIGDITRWHTNLSQCHNATGGFYFKDVQEQIALGIPEVGSTAYCCLISGITTDPLYKNVSFKDGTYHYILTTSGSAPTTGIDSTFTCEKF